MIRISLEFKLEKSEFIKKKGNVFIFILSKKQEMNIKQTLHIS